VLTQNGEMDSILFIVKKKNKSTMFIYIYLCTQKVKRNLLPLFINCCWHRILERWIVFIVYTESKKKSIRFIYLYLCTQKEYFSYRVVLFNCCWHKKKKESIAFIYSLLLTQNGEMDSILFIVKKKNKSIGLFIYICVRRN
jgi:hypothetical protein